MTVLVNVFYCCVYLPRFGFEVAAIEKNFFATLVATTAKAFNVLLAFASTYVVTQLIVKHFV